MNNQVKALWVRAITAVIVALLAWRFGTEVSETNITPMVEMLLGVVAGWLALRKPGDVPKEDHEEAVRRASMPPKPPLYVLAFALLTLPHVTACGASVEQTTRATLNSLQAVADPAYETAMALCEDQQRAVVARVNTEGWKEAYGEQFEAISARCHKTREAFDVIRALHGQAAAFVEAGRIGEAQRVIAELLATWKSLRGGS